MQLDPEAAANWLMVYMTYFRNLVVTTARRLYQSIGLRAGMMQLGNIVEEAIENSFSVQRKAAAGKGMRLKDLDDLFELNKMCHHDAAKKLAHLGIEVFKIGRDDQGRYYMETSDCNIFHALKEAPILRVFPIALVSGLIRGLGYRSRWLSNVSEKEHLCRSIGAGESIHYDYVVYLDDAVKPPGCRILVERLECGSQ